MMEVSELAGKKLAAYLRENNISSAVRVFMMQGGCSGPALGLALDEKKDNDESFTSGDLTFLVEKGLHEQCGSINIDFIEAGDRSGFQVASTNPLPGGGCSAGSCGSGGCSC